MDHSRIDDLLLCCLRAAPDATADGRLATLSSADWDAVIDTSGRHGTAPLLYYRLSTSHSEARVPANVMGRLRRAYLDNGARNMGLYLELGKVLERLRRDNIAVIVLKGAHLGAIVYGNTALRSMNDLDVLVHQDDLLMVEHVLLGMGYVPTECHRQIADDNCHFVYRLPGREVFVEVHWNLMPSMYGLKIDINGQWERSRPAAIAGVEVSVLCPDDLLLYLSVHTSKHVFTTGLRPLHDIVETIRYYENEIDWQLVLRRSVQWGVAKCVYVTLRLAREVLEASVPDEVLKTVTSSELDERFMVLARERVFGHGHVNADAESFSPRVARLWGSEAPLSKGALFLRRTFPSSARMARMYPAPSDSIRIFFYYPLRMRDLLLRHGRQVWRLLRGDKKMQALASRQNETAVLKEWLMSP